MRNHPLYPFFFAGVVCIICGIILTFGAQGLKPQQDLNLKIDIQKNILRAVGIPAAGETLANEDVEAAYKTNIREFLLNTSGQIVRGKTPADIAKENPNGYLPLFARVEGTKVLSYVVPVSGKGLWSTIYGYLAINPDGETVGGITFYKHGETPGLGGEVEKDWFTSNFVGKKIYAEDGVLQSVIVAKGKVVDSVAEADRDHYVDGISGSTMTCKGVSNFIKSDLTKYEPFFKRVHAHLKEAK